MGKRKLQKRLGFTLIELLVVIAIIGILAATILVALQSSRKSARDARRVSDIRSIMNALQLYYDNAGEYPTGDALVLDNNYLCTGGSAPGWVSGGCGTDQERLLAGPISPLPPDNPIGASTCDDTNNAYTYTQIDSGLGYEVSFCLGGKTGELSEGTCTLDQDSMHCP